MSLRLLVAVVSLAAAFAAPAALAQTKLRFAHTLPPSDTHNAAALRFAELVSARTNGQIVVEVHPAGALGNDPGILQNLRTGALEIGLTGNPFFTAFAPKLNALDLPYLFDDYAHVYRVVDGPVGEKLLAELEANQLKGLAFWEIGFRNLTNSVRPVRLPDDIKGLKIRTTPNPAHVSAFRALGAIPTPMPFPEVYLALQTKAVDGQENPVGLIYASKFHEVQKHMTLSRHAYTVSIVAMNLGRFNALTPEQRSVLVAAAREAAAYQRKLNRDSEGDALAKIRQAGVEVVDAPDIARFRAAAGDGAMKDYVAKHGSDLVDAIAKARQ
jgi:tripartite ATP-independent transporter DctP family solute receptor